MKISRSEIHYTILAVLALMFAFAVASLHLQAESLWNDEAWTAWAAGAPRLSETVSRIQADVHPPLYFVLLHGWMRLAGESEYALRLPSALLGMIALAATYAVGARLFDRRTGLIALLILGTASFFVYYTREARMYTLLLALGALSMLTYLRWRERPTLFRAGVYGVMMAALLYTHYAGVFVILAQIIHAILGIFRTRYSASLQTIMRNGWRNLAPYGLTFLLFAPWLPTLARQVGANPNGPLAIPVPTDWGAVAALVLILTSAHWGLLLAPFLLGSAIPRLRQYSGAVILLALWLLLTPLGLLALNAWFTPVYQVRYTIALLPAGALLLAYGFRWLDLWPRWSGISSRLAALVSVALLAWLVYTQLAMYSEFWGEKPRWRELAATMVQTRQPLEPAITDLAPYSPLAYYDRQLRIRQGISLDLSWRLHSAEEVWNITNVFTGTGIDKLNPAPSIWAVLPVNTAKTWHILSQFDMAYVPVYRSSLVNMIVYRFDWGGGARLDFRFGDLLRFSGGSSAGDLFSVGRGDELCTAVYFNVLAPLDGSYSAGLHLVDITGNRLIAQYDQGLGTPQAGEILELADCLVIPPDVPPGHYHLELVVYNWGTLERLPLLEVSAEPPLGWGDVLMLAAVDVTE